jgi:hypothetical protein
MGLQCVHEFGLSCGITPKLIACSSHSGLFAVYGTVDGARSCVLIVSIASPRAQVLVKLPVYLDTAPAISIEWSPAGVEEMLLVACEDGNLYVLSMSSPSRCAPKPNASLRLHQKVLRDNRNFEGLNVCIALGGTGLRQTM